jgi:SAM-dependent methyltransferase
VTHVRSETGRRGGTGVDWDLSGEGQKRGNTVTADGVPGSEPGYRLVAEGREEAEDERLDLLEQLFDPGSRRRRDLVQPGWRCLEIGAGRGSMATWLAERVGTTGQVVATDIDCRYLARLDLPNLRVVQHNIVEDPLDVLGPGTFDLVSARLVLFWLTGKQEKAIHQMAACLRPGGWLIDEEGDWGMPGPVDPSHRLYAGYHQAFKNGQWWAARGYDPFFGRKLPTLFERCGLQNIDHQATASVVRGASPWTRWWQQTLDVTRAWGLASGGRSETTDEEHQALTAPCSDPSAWFITELLHACSGQRPG